ncbi:MAG: tetratricopeptide repeat protein, partial [Candidatus Saccharicenans sp.]
MKAKEKSFLFLVLAAFIFFSFSCAPIKKTGSESEFTRHLNSGINFLHQGNYELARQEFAMAINLNKKSARAHNFMGLAYFRDHNYEYAEMYFQKAIKLDPKFATGYLNLAGVYALEELYPKAIEYYQKAISLSPNLVSAYYSLGAVYFQTGDKEKGTYYLTKGLELDPNYLDQHADSLAGLPMKGSALPELYFSFAKLYASRGDVDKTVEYLNKARQYGFKDWKRIEIDPEFSTVREDVR